jgi:hypothetical protein
LEGLVDHLLDNTASKFAKCFLLTCVIAVIASGAHTRARSRRYKSFTTPQELLALLERNYLQHNRSADDIEAKKLRLRICNFLKSWYARCDAL